DRRFSPVGREETDIEIEISLLSPMKRLVDRRRFQVNRDGGYLRSGHLSGLLLPQVAESRGWTSEQFLSALARKAGAPDDVYDQPETKLYTFRAQIVQ
ncbi:MAG: AMMECR1 domain-containing protein, partial [bacterium]|nr:AMMECR1 domain-containing protein [bacterium]